MRAGIQYVGFVRNQAHAAWLNNVLDQAALSVICATGACLHHQELATCIQEQFQDTLNWSSEAEVSEDRAADDET